MTDIYAVPGEMLTGIANAIRSKTGSDEQMPVSAMAAAIEGISGGGPANEGTIIPNSNTITIDTGIDSPNGFVLIRSSLQMNGVRTFFAFIYTKNVILCVGSNSVGTSASSTCSVHFDISAITPTEITINGRFVTIKVKNAGGSGEFYNEIHHWYAWKA